MGDPQTLKVRDQNKFEKLTDKDEVAKIPVDSEPVKLWKKVAGYLTPAKIGNQAKVQYFDVYGSEHDDGNVDGLLSSSSSKAISLYDTYNEGAYQYSGNGLSSNEFDKDLLFLTSSLVLFGIILVCICCIGAVISFCILYSVINKLKTQNLDETEYV